MNPFTFLSVVVVIAACVSMGATIIYRVQLFSRLKTETEIRERIAKLRAFQDRVGTHPLGADLALEISELRWVLGEMQEEIGLALTEKV